MPCETSEQVMIRVCDENQLFHVVFPAVCYRRALSSETLRAFQHLPIHVRSWRQHGLSERQTHFHKRNGWLHLLVRLAHSASVSTNQNRRLHGSVRYRHSIYLRCIGLRCGKVFRKLSASNFLYVRLSSRACFSYSKLNGCKTLNSVGTSCNNTLKATFVADPVPPTLPEAKLHVLGNSIGRYIVEKTTHWTSKEGFTFISAYVIDIIQRPLVKINTYNK